MSTEKLSTGCAMVLAELKKREGEKRHSPSNPYREKGKGKEDSRGSWKNRLSCARSRVRKALDADLDMAVSAFHGTDADRRADACR